MNVAGLVDSTFLQTRMNDVLESAPETVLGMYEGMIPQVNLETGTVPNFLFGCFSMALTLFMVVPSVTQAFGISALPNVTAAWTKGSRGELKHSMETVLRITSLFCIPSGLGMCVLSGPGDGAGVRGTAVAARHRAYSGRFGDRGHLRVIERAAEQRKRGPVSQTGPLFHFVHR